MTIEGEISLQGEPYKVCVPSGQSIMYESDRIKCDIEDYEGRETNNNYKWAVLIESGSDRSWMLWGLKLNKKGLNYSYDLDGTQFKLDLKYHS